MQHCSHRYLTTLKKIATLNFLLIIKCILKKCGGCNQSYLIIAELDEVYKSYSSIYSRYYANARCIKHSLEKKKKRAAGRGA